MSRIFSILQTTKRRLGFLGRVQDLSHKFNDTGITDLIITGDFNFPHIDWSTISSAIDDDQPDKLKYTS